MNAITPVPASVPVVFSPAPEGGHTEFVFTFGDKELRGIAIGERPVFVAKDVATALSYRDAPNLNRVLRAKEKGTHSVSTPGGVQRLSTITEAGLYRAIMQRKVVADLDPLQRIAIERFQDYVVEEVLPTIRRKGSYHVAPVPEPVQVPGPVTLANILEALRDPANAIAIIEQQARETLAEREAHAVTHKQLVVQTAVVATLSERVEADRPAVLAQKRMAAGTGELLLSDAAITIGVDRVRVVDRLIEMGLLRRGGDRRLRCTREGRLSGLVRNSLDRAEDAGEGGAEPQGGRSRVRVTASGFAVLSEHFCRGANAARQDVLPGV